ncbi:M48 family metallopeptidase [Pelagibius sp. CAU 1746]|uniref:M48 family metallopeptidase n=1 Tax=Pelagibius sp. CAU 1746 TaxID=3140370 RepID=UPI00325B4D08
MARRTPWGPAPSGPESSGPESSGPLPSGQAPSGLARTDFHAAIRRNAWNTFWLCLVLVLVGVALGYVFGWVFEVFFLAPPEGGLTLDPLAVSAGGLRGAAIMAAASALAVIVALTRGDRIVLGLAGAREVTPEEEPRLHNVAEEMALAAGLPKPRVFVIETPALNAFATGRKPEKAAIAVTRGLMDKLSRSELQGVVGHEMGHIANNDILYATAVGVLVGLIVLICDAALRSLRHVRFTGGRRGKQGGAAVIALVVLLVFAILAPLAARLVQMAISRQREYMADATAVKLTRNPLGLIGALQKIGGSDVRYENANRAIQHLYIANPVKSFGPKARALFSTHPAMEDRIVRLRNLG